MLIRVGLLSVDIDFQRAVGKCCYLRVQESYALTAIRTFRVPRTGLVACSEDSTFVRRSNHAERLAKSLKNQKIGHRSIKEQELFTKSNVTTAVYIHR